MACLPLQHGLPADALLHVRVGVQRGGVDLAVIEQSVEETPFARRPRQERLDGRRDHPFDPICQLVPILGLAPGSTPKKRLDLPFKGAGLEERHRGTKLTRIVAGGGQKTDERDPEFRALDQVGHEVQQSRGVEGVACGGALDQRRELPRRQLFDREGRNFQSGSGGKPRREAHDPQMGSRAT